MELQKRLMEKGVSEHYAKYVMAKMVLGAKKLREVKDMGLLVNAVSHYVSAIDSAQEKEKVEEQLMEVLHNMMAINDTQIYMQMVAECYSEEELNEMMEDCYNKE